MGTEFGYVYDYEFCMVDEDEINSKHKAKKLKSNGSRVLVFDIRTNFIVVLRSDEGIRNELIDSERYDTSVYDDEPDMFLCQHILERLKDYWMTFPEIRTLTRSAFAFAKQMAARPANERLRLIPVVVSLEVFTVQKEGESQEAVMERAICSQRLIPLYLYPWPTTVTEMPLKPIDDYVKLSVLSLPRARVEDTDQELARRMSVCHFCSKRACVGDQITLLKCNHAFHSHCGVPWLEDNSECPLCNSIVYLKYNNTPNP